MSKHQDLRERTLSELYSLGYELPPGVTKNVEKLLPTMFEKSQTSLKALFQGLFSNYASGKRRLILSIFIAILAEILAFVAIFFGAYAASFVYRHLSGEIVDYTQLVRYGLWALLLLTLHLLLAGGSSLMSHQVAFQSLHRLRLRLFRHLQEIPQGYLIENSLAQIRVLIQERVGELEDFIAHVMPEFPSRLIHPILSFAVLLYIDWRLALALFVPLPFVLLGMTILFKKYRGRYLLWNCSYEDLAEKTVDYVRGIPVVKAFQQTERSFINFASAANYYHETTMGWWRNSWLGTSLTLAAFSAPLLGCLPVALLLFRSGELTAAEFFLAVILPLAILPQAFALMMSFEVFTMCSNAWSEISELLYQPAQVRPSDFEGSLDLTKGVDFKNVSFSYLSGQEVLHDVSFQLKPQTLNALVGHSGSGKSTIARLLLGFWDCSEGEIRLGGVNVKHLPFAQLLSEIAYVSQENFLFDATIADNIRLGKPDATMEEVKAAAMAARCHDFIMQLPQGYDSKVGEAGGSISGGERQRITIARAMLKPASIVVLDEATAYTDPENEAEIQKAIIELLRDKTVLVIAHRLHTVVGADQIIVLDEGRVAASGQHRELLEHSTTYRQLWRQYSGEEQHV